MVAYQAALQDRAHPVGDRVSACLAIDDPDLAGDCALQVGREAANRGEVDMAVLCPRVSEGLWRDECWFEAAELARKDSDTAAVALCDQAGPFRDDCHQHLWQSSVEALVNTVGPEHFADRLDQAQALHDRWERLLGDDEEHTYRFWRCYYRAGLGAMHPLDLYVCDTLPALQRERCLEAGIAAYTSRLEAATRDVGREAILCGRARRGALLEHIATIGRDTHVVPHPRLEQAAREFQQDNCMMLGPGSSPP